MPVEETLEPTVYNIVEYGFKFYVPRGKTVE